jgi:hypothetical protein
MQRNDRNARGRFLPGHVKLGGRKRGVRNKINKRYVQYLSRKVMLEIEAALENKNPMRAVRFVEAISRLATHNHVRGKNNVG